MSDEIMSETLDIKTVPYNDRPSCAYDLTNLPSFSPEFLAKLSEQSRLRHIIIGFPNDVSQEILNLHRCGYDVDVWSPPQRILGSAEVITVCIKRARRTESGNF